MDSLVRVNGNSDSRHSSPISHEQQRPETVKEIQNISQTYSNIGDKDILFGRGKSIRQRAPNLRLLNFVDIFRDHYCASGPFERSQIVQRIVGMLQNDGYSFRKQQKRLVYTSHSLPVVGESSDEFDDEGMDDVARSNRISWVEMSPSEVHKKVAQLFRKSPGQFLDSSTTSGWKQHHEHQHQQQVAAFHQAISSAIDVSSIQRNEEQRRVEALDHAITSAIDVGSIAKAMRDCPSPAAPALLSTSSSFSAFDPVIPQSATYESPEEQEIDLEPTLLSIPLSPSPSIEYESHEPLTGPIANVHGESNTETTTPTSAALHAGKVFQQQFKTTSREASVEENAEPNLTLQKDQLLWSKGTQEIRLLQNMDNDLIPVQSVSIFSNVQQVAFEKKQITKRAKNGRPPTVDLSRTIGYTQQQVGKLTILRPIVLLP